MVKHLHIHSKEKHSHGRFVLLPKAKKELKERAKEFLEKDVSIKIMEGTKYMKGEKKAVLRLRKSLIPAFERFAIWALEHPIMPNCEVCGTK